MTDMRERVARAIYTAKWGKDPGDWSGSVATITFRLQADAALRECGYAEMRKVLEKATHAISRIGANIAEFNYVTDDEFFDALWEAEKSARSILERTGEK